jgi:cytidylate kinase
MPFFFPNQKYMSDQKKITIAIDGYSSCGKSTLAKALAKELNYIFIDTGAMYRAVAFYAFRKNWISENTFEVKSIIENLPNIELHFEINKENGKPEIYINKENVESKIRGLEISNLVSRIASIKEVRSKLVSEQRKMGLNGGIVMDGRDIGSVVFPDAEVKFFITADPKIRAERRYKELQATNPNITLYEIEKNLIERDLLDSTREESPLLKTSDSILIDNSLITVKEQFELALKHVYLNLKK